MTPSLNRRALAVVIAGGLVPGGAAQAQAAEIGFFEALFGGGAAGRAGATEPASPTYAGYAAGVRHRSRQVARPRPRIRYAALPASEPLKVRITDRQKPIDMKGGAAAALMKDETLRPGDIVVLNTGARVFTGDPDAAHTMRDFVPVERSAYVDRGTRKQLAALMAPASALPADQARKFVERLKSTPRTPATLVPQQASMRIISALDGGAVRRRPRASGRRGAGEARPDRAVMAGGRGQHEAVPDRVLERQRPPDVEHHTDRVERAADRQQPERRRLKGAITDS